MNFLLSLVWFLVMFAVTILLIMIGKKFLFSKIAINKYIPLALSVLALICQIFIKSSNMILNAGLTIIIILFFAWYFDINQTGGPKKGQKKIVMKPKAKPNRIKNEKK